jgi:hypothetical protein
MRHICWIASLALICLVLVPRQLHAEPFRFPEAKRGKGELKYVHNIPVLTLAGTPDEIGDQLGELGLKPASELTTNVDELIKQYGWQTLYTTVSKTGSALLPFFPPDHVLELNAAGKVTKAWPREILIFGNTVPDMQRIVQCSTFIVDAERSATGGPLFGRNLDWPPFGKLEELTLVIICRPKGKRAFASITYPGLLGCSSAINDAGLAVALLDSYSTNDGSDRYNPRGTPTMLALRRVMEECSTVSEAAQLLRQMDRAAIWNVAVCDKSGGAVFEFTPKSLVVRPSSAGVSICTNHFRTTELATDTNCSRFERLQASNTLPKYAIEDIAKRMDSVNQGAATLQTMVFEPAALRLHLAFGKGPATRLPLKALELKVLFGTR